MTTKVKPMKVEKKATAKKRQQIVAREYQAWLEKHPGATTKQKIKQLDAISDSAFLQQEIEKWNRQSS